MTNHEMIEQLKALEQTLEFEEMPEPWEIKALAEAIRQLENREKCPVPDNLWIELNLEKK